MQKKLFTIVESSEEEGKKKLVERVTKKSKGEARQPWKPKIEEINLVISNEGNFVQMKKFHDLYRIF